MVQTATLPAITDQVRPACMNLNCTSRDVLVNHTAIRRKHCLNETWRLTAYLIPTNPCTDWINFSES